MITALLFFYRYQKMGIPPTSSHKNTPKPPL